MSTGNTSLLGLALPVEGELDGTWGDVVNDSITSLVDSAVAGTTILSTDADVTLTDTSLAANQARQAILRWTASNGATTRNITAPARSKPYIVINAGTGSCVLRGAGPTTGITIAAGESCVAAWDGSDFVKVSTNAAGAGGVTLDGVQTLTNKTLTTPVLSAVASGIVAGRLGYLSGVLSFGDGSVQRSVATLDGTQTFTNKTLTTPLLSAAASGTIAGSLGYLAGVLSFGDGSVQRAVATVDGTQTLTNKTLTLPVISSISNTGVLTLPTSTDTLVGPATSDTLTNKTISADSNTFSGIAASSFVTSDASGNIDGSATQKAIPSGAVVGTTDTQTLTNKTISADSNTLSGIAASSFVLSNASGNIDGSAAQKVIPSGAVVGTTDTQTLTNKTLTSPTITGATFSSATFTAVTLNDGYTEEVLAISGTTPALTPTTASIQTWSLTANSTPTAGTWASGQSLTLMIDDGSSRTINWASVPVTWKTDGGAAPTLNTTGYTVIQLWKVSTTIYGARVGDA